MKELFHPDSRLMRLLSLGSSLIALNLIWLLFCIPAVTIGASTTAMYSVSRKIIHGEEPAVFRTFYKTFRRELKQTLLLSLIMLVPVLMAAWFVFLSAYGRLDGSGWFKVLCYVSIAIIGMVSSYLWPLTAWFDNHPGNTLKNALLIPLSNPFAAAIVTVLNLSPLILLRVNTMFFLQSGLFWIIIGGALVAHINTRILEMQFQRYL